MPLILDIGCGHAPKGDVNVDLFPQPTPHRGSRDWDLEVKKMRNFVVASAESLPFRDSTFETVYSSHTIEHVRRPARMLKEMARVSKKEIIVKCPYRFSTNAFNNREHISFFNKNWFILAFSQIGINDVTVKYSGYRFPRMIPLSVAALLRLPDEIEAIANKVSKPQGSDSREHS